MHGKKKVWCETAIPKTIEKNKETERNPCHTQWKIIYAIQSALFFLFLSYENRTIRSFVKVCLLKQIMFRENAVFISCTNVSQTFWFKNSIEFRERSFPLLDVALKWKAHGNKRKTIHNVWLTQTFAMNFKRFYCWKQMQNEYSPKITCFPFYFKTIVNILKHSYLKLQKIFLLDDFVGEREKKNNNKRATSARRMCVCLKMKIDSE